METHLMETNLIENSSKWKLVSTEIRPKENSFKTRPSENSYN